MVAVQSWDVVWMLLGRIGKLCIVRLLGMKCDFGALRLEMWSELIGGSPVMLEITETRTTL